MKGRGFFLRGVVRERRENYDRLLESRQKKDGLLFVSSGGLKAVAMTRLVRGSILGVPGRMVWRK